MKKITVPTGCGKTQMMGRLPRTIKMIVVSQRSLAQSIGRIMRLPDTLLDEEHHSPAE